MSLEDREKINKIEDLKSKLFSSSYQPKTGVRDSFIHRERHEVPDSWEKDENDMPNLSDKIFMKTSAFKKFFIFSIFFLVLAVGYAAYMFFAGGNIVSNNNITLSVLGNSFTAGGEELPLQIEITNKNNSALELADLVVEYPKSSSSDVLKSTDMERQRVSLGTIPAGATKSENIKITIFGEQGSSRDVKVSLEYRVQGSNAIFVKDTTYPVSISSAPINLSIEAPTETSPNQDVSLKVKATLNATKITSNIMLKVDYPVGFQFVSATPAPSFGNNVWSLGDLPPGAEREISIAGRMVDVFDGEEKTFHVWGGSQSDSDKSAIGVIFNSLGHTIAIKKPFLEARLVVNGSTDSSISTNANNPIQVEIRWNNNLDTKINDMKIVAKLSGNALNRRTISTQQGFYNSLDDTITWDKNSRSNFAEVSPGDADSVIFSVSSLPLFSAGNGMLVEPSIGINVSISGKQAFEGNYTQEVNSSDSKTIKIISDVGLATKILHDIGSLVNTGPVPPKVGVETTYTVVWNLSNSANPVSKAKISATLPSWVRFVGSFLPPMEDLSYNSSTRELVWNVGTIPKGTGITGEAREISFQIAITPSLSQVGTGPTLINEVTLTGHDDFANVDVRASRGSLNTKLLNDFNAPLNNEIVVE